LRFFLLAAAGPPRSIVAREYGRNKRIYANAHQFAPWFGKSGLTDGRAVLLSGRVAGGLDQEGVGKLVEMGVKLGRETRPDLEIGICGEHGGEPSSVEFCYRVGMNYVSCSPYRVPIARLAAAQAAISGDKSETMRTA